MSERRLWFLLIVAAIGTMAVGYVTVPDAAPIELHHDWGFMDAIDIFVNNLIVIGVLVVFSPLGVPPFLFSFYFWYNIGAVATEADIGLLSFIVASAPHGIGEVACTIAVCVFTIKQYRVLLAVFRGTSSLADLKAIYVRFLTTTFPVIVLVLLCSAFIEVYVSNTLMGLFV